MPGKVNPVIPEVVNQSCYYVIDQDLTVTMAAEAGQLQLNVMEPVIAFAMFTSFEYLGNAILSLIDKCVVGITANPEHCARMVMNSIGIVTQLNPIFGYETCSSIAGDALISGKSVHQIVVIERKLIDQAKWDEIFSVEATLARGVAAVVHNAHGRFEDQATLLAQTQREIKIFEIEKKILVEAIG